MPFTIIFQKLFKLNIDYFGIKSNKNKSNQEIKSVDSVNRGHTINEKINN